MVKLELGSQTFKTERLNIRTKETKAEFNDQFLFNGFDPAKEGLEVSMLVQTFIDS